MYIYICIYIYIYIYIIHGYSLVEQIIDTYV